MAQPFRSSLLESIQVTKSWDTRSSRSDEETGKVTVLQVIAIVGVVLAAGGVGYCAGREMCEGGSTAVQWGAHPSDHLQSPPQSPPPSPPLSTTLPPHTPIS